MEQERYSIKDLEHFTQIKAHTIRIWEQRFGLLHPKRTPTNIRYYNDDDLKKILNINLLYTGGWKISKIAKLSEKEIQGKAELMIRNKGSEDAPNIDSLIVDILAFDQRSIMAKLDQQFAAVGMIELYEKMVLPVLIRIGELWQVNTLQVLHEHFLSNTLREFIIAKQRQLSPTSTKKKAILFLHAGEEHELSLLFQRYVLTLQDYVVCYLGPRLPIEQLPTIIHQHEPDLLVTNYISKIAEKSLLHQLDFLNSTCNAKLLISGNQAEKHVKAIGAKAIITHSLSEFDQLIK